jgi:hypothetical protein
MPSESFSIPQNPIENTNEAKSFPVSVDQIQNELGKVLRFYFIRMVSF